jgi:hypothetical protein
VQYLCRSNLTPLSITTVRCARSTAEVILRHHPQPLFTVQDLLILLLKQSYATIHLISSGDDGRASGGGGELPQHGGIRRQPEEL